MTWSHEVDAYRHVTPAQVAACCPQCDDPEAWARAFDAALERFPVDDVAMLLAQCGHESADMTRLEESLWYSAERLVQVWPSRFPTVAAAQPYVGNPEALANNVYAGRMGNDKPGDGWRYRGRGCIQLTGRYNYKRFAAALRELHPMTTPDAILEPEYAALAACWYYHEHVPAGASVEQATRAINGGTHGLEDRQSRYERCEEAMR